MPEWLLDLFARYGYAVVFGGVFLENTGLPVPGETALLAGAALAHFGQLSLPRVIVDGDRRRDRSATTSGSSSAAAAGARIAERHGWRIGLTPDAAGASSIGSSSGTAPKTVFAARFITGLRVVGAVLAGGSGMRWPTFLVLQRRRRGRLVHGGGVRRILAGLQLGHARALDRPHRSDRAGARGRGWCHRRACARDGIVTP